MKPCRQISVISWVFLSLMLLMGGAGASFAATCPSDRVSVDASTRIRKGPGTNYRVGRVLKQSRCVSIEQVSMDGRWTLVRFGKRKQLFGWVFTKRLGDEAQEEAMSAMPEQAPLGTGLGRQFAQLAARADMRDVPSSRGRLVRSLTSRALVLPLRQNPDGDWVEVRDRRGAVGWVEAEAIQGEALAGLPVAEDMDMMDIPSSVSPTPLAERPKLSRFVQVPDIAAKRISGPSDSVRATVLVGGGAFAPLIRLNSNGQAANRRYDLSAVAAGVSGTLQVNGLGAFSARVNYDLGMFQSQVGDTADVINGRAHSFSGLAGWAISLGGSVLIPEIGYGFDITLVDAVAPSLQQVTFISTETHAALLGLRFQKPIGRKWFLEANANFLGGFSSSAPLTLGDDNGVTIGGRGGLGLQYLFNQGLALALQYRITGFSSEFTGTGTLDATISQAIITEIRQTLVLGVSYGL